ncbi:MAG TPA: 6-hydroxymethylpterin diphosphokinase MptE-like protein [Bacillota bacterium]|nr:6-hydroxymethylpterin diphosphokinase MptE-like protein [Bacillota bacterium]
MISFELTDTVEGQKTVQVQYRESGERKRLYLHSKYSPMKEAARFAQENMANQKKINVVYGFGLGYHVEKMLDLLEDDNELHVFDLNYHLFRESLNYRDYSKMLADSRLKLYITPRLGELADKLAKVLDGGEPANIVLHMPSVNSLDDDHLQLKYVLMELNLRKNIDQQSLALLEKNFQENRSLISRNVGEFFGRFPGIPAIIVAAGPSLDKNKHLLKGIQDKCLIIAVAQALRSLLETGVKPHIMVTIDPQDITYNQIQGYENLDIPFFLMATAAPVNARRYQGPKFIACQQESYLLPEEKHFLIKPGGSVSTTALDIAIRMGCNPIAYVGQDLAFTDNLHHSRGTYHDTHEVKILKNMRMVEDRNKQMVPTTLGMISFRNWISRRVAEEADHLFVNATEGGAFIPGLEHISLQEYIDKYITAVPAAAASKTVDAVVQGLGGAKSVL